MHSWFPSYIGFAVHVGGWGGNDIINYWPQNRKFLKINISTLYNVNSCSACSWESSCLCNHHTEDSIVWVLGNWSQSSHSSEHKCLGNLRHNKEAQQDQYTVDLGHTLLKRCCHQDQGLAVVICMRSWVHQVQHWAFSLQSSLAFF